MRIVSKFSDYYDIGIAYGIDQNIYFSRFLETVEDNQDSFLRVRELDIGEFTYSLYPSIIGFCGKIYPLIIMTKYYKNEPFSNRKILETNFFYSNEEILDYFDIDLTKREMKYNTRFNRDYFDFSKKRNDYFLTLFKKYNVPIFFKSNFNLFNFSSFGYSKQILLNPSLSDLKFFKVKDALTAFQEISLFLGSLKYPELEKSNFDDRIIAQSKGFDCMSFKKEGTKTKKC